MEPCAARRRLLERRSANSLDCHIILTSFRAAAVSCGRRRTWPPCTGGAGPLAAWLSQGRAGRQRIAPREGTTPATPSASAIPRAVMHWPLMRSVPPVLTAPMPGASSAGDLVRAMQWCPRQGVLGLPPRGGP